VTKIENINWMTVIVSVIMSSITAYITTTINLVNLSNNLVKFREDIIETCTTEVSSYVNSVVKRFK
jgi:tetrahydromethanopterin S-methyltransferase subunit C